MVLFVEQAPNLAAAVIIICIFAYITFGLRVYSRMCFTSWGLEDWCMTAALPFFTVLSVACIACAFTGIGATNKTLSLPENAGYMQQGLFVNVFYGFDVLLVKLSISVLIMRIAEGRRAYIYAQYIVIGMFVTMNLVASFYIIFHCNPVAAAWEQSLLRQGGKCNDAQTLADIYYATTAVNIFTDWVTAFMPIPLLWGVQMNRNTKISVAVILGLGFFASLSACIRLKYTVGLTDSKNYLYSISDIVIWGYAENGLGVIVGCAATLRPVFRHLSARLGFDKSTSNILSSTAAVAVAGEDVSGFRSKSHRTYAECGMGYELSRPRNARDKLGNLMSSTRVGRGDDEDDDLWESESQKKMWSGSRADNGDLSQAADEDRA